MKIVHNENICIKKFANLEQGQVFLFDNQYFMKTVEVYADYNDPFNAVHLDNGNFLYVAPGVNVKLINCELVIKE